MRLIDADAYAFPGDLINEPTVDAVEVVRCIDCKHFQTETVEEQTPYGFTNDKKVCGCMLRGEWVDVFIDDFCSYGERKGL